MLGVRRPFGRYIDKRMDGTLPFVCFLLIFFLPLPLLTLIYRERGCEPQLLVNFPPQHQLCAWLGSINNQ